MWQLGFLQGEDEGCRNGAAAEGQEEPETFISQAFGAKLASQIECTACGFVAPRIEDFMDISVEIAQPVFERAGGARYSPEALKALNAVSWVVDVAGVQYSALSVLSAEWKLLPQSRRRRGGRRQASHLSSYSALRSLQRMATCLPSSGESRLAASISHLPL